MDRRIKNIFWMVGSISVFVLLVIISEPSRFVDSLRNADILPVLLAAVFGSSVTAVWAFQWFKVFQDLDLGLGYLYCLKLFLGGKFLDNITPVGRAGGEPLIAYLVSKETGDNVGKILPGIASADLINNLPMFVFMALASFYLIFFQPSNMSLALTGLIFTVIFLLIFLLVLFRPLMIVSGLSRIRRIGTTDLLPAAVSKNIGSAIESLEQLEDRSSIFWLISVAHLAYLFQISSLYLVLSSLALDPGIEVFLILPIAFLGNISPSPGGLGTYDSMMAGGILLLLSAPLATAVSAALLFRLTTYLPGIILGYWSIILLKGFEER